MDFEQWINGIVDSEHPGEDIIGFYFGIFESDPKEFTVYLTGSSEFDEEDEEWASNNNFEPEEKYLLLTQCKNFSYVKVEREVTMLIKKFLDTEVCKNSFFARAKAIVTGFDDGDLIHIK
ncbi:MAG: hypothetical protein LBT50_00890 [Prevotellaceae bacterium]|nr:hypothetical protein [Prevotellaceae bacterium]